jgi:hypothetical protein
MSAVALQQTIETAFTPFADGVRRWRDLDIAEWLGLAEPYSIRDTIERNRAELERHGVILVRQAKISGAGRPTSENYLCFEQGMVICTLSRTPRAEDVRTMMIQVFSRVVKGEISTAPRMELRALEVAADRIVAPILEEQRKFYSQMVLNINDLRGDVSDLKSQVGAHDIMLRQAMKMSRFDPKEKDKRICIVVCGQRYDGLCPCCKTIEICREGQKLSNLQIDHFFGPSKRKLTEIWPVCGGNAESCNLRLEDPQFRMDKMSAFNEFQAWVRVYLTNSDKQLRLL